MKKVFIVEPEAALRKAFELKFGHDFLYSLEGFEDFGFRVADFGPDILIVSCKLAFEENKKSVEEYLKKADALCLTLGFPREIEQARAMGWDYPALELPLNFSTLVEKTLSYTSD